MSKTATVIYVPHEPHLDVAITKGEAVRSGDSSEANQPSDETINGNISSTVSMDSHDNTSHLQDVEVCGRKPLGLPSVAICETTQMINSFVDVIRFFPVTTATSRIFRSQCGIMDGTPVIVKIVEKGIRDQQIRQEFHTLISIHRELTARVTKEEARNWLPGQRYNSDKWVNSLQLPYDASSYKRMNRDEGSEMTRDQPRLGHFKYPTSLGPSEVLRRIVKPLRLLETGSELALVMERLAGPDLCQYLLDHRQGRLSEEECQLVVYNALLILKEIHNLGFVHRDVTLPNLVLRDANNLESLSLVDFGIAGRMDLPEEMIRMCGSPGSCAPEILLGNNKGPHFDKFDVFSLGVVLFTILSGSPPFVAKSPIAILRLNCRAEVSFQKAVWENVSFLAKDLTTRMTERDPALRISVSEALEHQWFHFLRKPSESSGDRKAE